ncbi:putative small nuclear ribonucleoprotein lsm2 protein [Botryosphaeria dothidea]|uniref:Small nuclear ribonucleoprotein lsm2 protein n=1 Tax=Botryosphaeria dothidea TaxID=55169 RepID=A0A8H4J078_9PEZI|nr:putative small nuclear ribonucleoprotein lsm2 protein [Botryosphaeria dothidea]
MEELSVKKTCGMFHGPADVHVPSKRGNDLRRPSPSAQHTTGPASIMLFFSFFKTLVDHEVTVELKNDISIRGTLKSVDQFLNIKLDDISVVEELKYPHLSSVKNVFIRGSVVRYVHLPGAAVDTALLEDATRREAAQAAAKTKQS